MKAILYTRVSTTKQATEGESLAAQESKLRAYAVFHGFEDVEVVTDAGVSGSTTNRAGFERVLQAVERKEIGAVVVYSLSRFARNTQDTLRCIERMQKRGYATYQAHHSEEIAVTCQQLDDFAARRVDAVVVQDVPPVLSAPQVVERLKRFRVVLGVCREDVPGFPGDLLHKGQHLLPLRRAQRGKGFVQQQDRPCPQQRSRQGRPAGLSTRQLRGAAGTQPGQADAVKRLFETLPVIGAKP